MSDPLMISKNDEGEVTVEVSSPGVIPQDMPTPLTGFLQISNPSQEEKSQLTAVWDYLKETAKEDRDSERLWTLRRLESRLGAPRLGQTRLQQIYQFIKIDKEVKSLEKLRDDFLA